MASTETETEKRTTTSDESDGSDLFDEFWKHYPRKDSKQDAIKAWKAVTKTTDAQVIVDAVKTYPFKPERQFQPLPASWLRGKRWEDEAAQLPLASVHSIQPKRRVQEVMIAEDVWREAHPEEWLMGRKTRWVEK